MIKLRTTFGTFAEIKKEIKIFLIYRENSAKRKLSDAKKALKKFGFDPGVLQKFGFAGNKEDRKSVV